MWLVLWRGLLHKCGAPLANRRAQAGEPRLLMPPASLPRGSLLGLGFAFGRDTPGFYGSV